eukprot:gnl/Trimastix_PCT/4310.p1 GENE.gnl/Trimastix_PCT/4310~~gnl/Trimastix_PCT/4310.p1  ORF type:complete len:1086 (-),score=302.46 gnl/Trimastix_PCT/4310:38-3220(-)
MDVLLSAARYHHFSQLTEEYALELQGIFPHLRDPALLWKIIASLLQIIHESPAIPETEPGKSSDLVFARKRLKKVQSAFRPPSPRSEYDELTKKYTAVKSGSAPKRIAHRSIKPSERRPPRSPSASDSEHEPEVGDADKAEMSDPGALPTDTDSEPELAAEEANDVEDAPPANPTASAEEDPSVASESDTEPEHDYAISEPESLSGPLDTPPSPPRTLPDATPPPTPPSRRLRGEDDEEEETDAYSLRSLELSDVDSISEEEGGPEGERGDVDEPAGETTETQRRGSGVGNDVDAEADDDETTSGSESESGSELESRDSEDTNTDTDTEGSGSEEEPDLDMDLDDADYEEIERRVEAEGEDADMDAIIDAYLLEKNERIWEEWAQRRAEKHAAERKRRRRIKRAEKKRCQAEAQQQAGTEAKGKAEEEGPPEQEDEARGTEGEDAPAQEQEQEHKMLQPPRRPPPLRPTGAGSGSGGSGAGRRGKALRRVRAPSDADLINLAELGEHDIQLLLKVQSWMRAYLARRRFRMTVLELLKSPVSRTMKERNYIMREILHTEETYQEGLIACLRAFKAPAQALLQQGDTLSPCITRDEAMELFFGIDELARFSQEMLRLLREEWARFPQSRMAHVFAEMAPRFRGVYLPFISTYDRRLTIIERVKGRPGGEAFFREGTANANGRQIDSLLITPIQRLPRYELLMKGLLKATPEEHTEHAQISIAYESCKQANQDVNEAQRRAEMFQRLRGLCEKITGLAKHDLVKPGRRVVRESCLTFSRPDGNTRAFVVLLTDYLIVAVPEWGNVILNSYRLEALIPLAAKDTQVTITPHRRKAFAVRTSKRTASLQSQSYLLEAGAESEASLWMKDLALALDPEKASIAHEGSLFRPDKKLKRYVLGGGTLTYYASASSKQPEGPTIALQGALLYLVPPSKIGYPFALVFPDSRIITLHARTELERHEWATKLLDAGVSGFYLSLNRIKRAITRMKFGPVHMAADRLAALRRAMKAGTSVTASSQSRSLAITAPAPIANAVPTQLSDNVFMTFDDQAAMEGTSLRFSTVELE